MKPFELEEYDIRGGSDEVNDAVRTAQESACTLYNSDEEYDDQPAPRAVLISQQRYQQLLETEWMYKDLCR